MIGNGAPWQVLALGGGVSGWFIGVPSGAALVLALSPQAETASMATTASNSLVLGIAQSSAQSEAAPSSHSRRPVA